VKHDDESPDTFTVVML